MGLDVFENTSEWKIQFCFMRLLLLPGISLLAFHYVKPSSEEEIHVPQTPQSSKCSCASAFQSILLLVNNWENAAFVLRCSNPWEMKCRHPLFKCQHRLSFLLILFFQVRPHQTSTQADNQIGLIFPKREEFHEIWVTNLFWYLDLIYKVLTHFWTL